MAEREVVLDESVTDEQSEHLRAAVERAEKAEAELAKLMSNYAASKSNTSTPQASDEGGRAQHDPAAHGLDALRQDAMMRHLLESLDAGKNIGHYGRLVFAMIARHFLSHQEMLAELTKDPDFNEEQARVMLNQVEDRDYSPPRRERIVEWQAQQEFPILPSLDDPDCGSVYRSLHFPEKTYKHITEYQEERLQPE
jgi:DNA primase large subunit